MNKRTITVPEDALRQELLALIEQRDAVLARVEELESALREAETLLTNYLAAGKFPPGSDCEEVRDIARRALEPSGP